MLPYQNPQLPIEERLDDLISRMTLDELIMQTDQFGPQDATEGTGAERHFSMDKVMKNFRGLSAGVIAVLSAKEGNQLQRYALEQTRLGIPFMISSEGVHGASLENATIFPQQIGMASSFEPGLARKMGHAIAAESRSSGIHEVWSPVMDLMRDPRFGRTEEAYGEDTFLASQFAYEGVSGMQGDDLTAPDAVASELKHYAAYGSPVAGLNCAPCAMSRHEVFTDSLPVFEAAIKDAGAMNVMCSYTCVGHVPVSMDHELLTEVLRDQWGMRGFVRADMTAVSRLYDWFFVADNMEDAIKLSLEAGLDMQYFCMPHETWQNGIRNLVESGKMDRSVVEQAARRMLRAKMLLGLFENPYTDETRAEKVIHCQAHQDLAEEIARKSFVLLKNKDNMLPLSKDLQTIAVIGPSAGQAMLGDYTPRGKTGISVLDGIRSRMPEATILYEQGCGFMGNNVLPIPADCIRDENGNPGLTGRYYNSRIPGENFILERTDRQVNFNWTIFNPDGTLFPRDFGAEGFSVVWTGTLEMPDSFDGFIGFGGEDSAKIYIDGELVVDLWGEKRFNDRLVPFSYEAGRKYAVRIEHTNDCQGNDVRFGYRRSMEDFTAAIEAAKKAQVAIVCVGDSGETSGENFDRIDLNLPGNQLDLVKAIYATGTPVVLVLQSGRPVSCTWEQKHIPAILQCSFPGERGGYAVADTLFGDNNPSGRLPITYPRHVGQVPCHYTRRPGGGRRYIDMGWTPLYPFGYGLSYTEFAYRGLTLSNESIAAGESITASVTVANVGGRAGTAVPQLYIRDWVSSTVKPLRYLCGFARVDLEPGEEKTVEITIGPKSMRTLDPNFVWSVEPGDFTVYLGENAEKMLFEQSFRVE